MTPKCHTTRQGALKAATKAAPDPGDRLVRPCTSCPPAAASTQRRADAKAKRAAVVDALTRETGASREAVIRAIRQGETDARRARWSAEARGERKRR